jgi:hypothetical protein
VFAEIGFGLLPIGFHGILAGLPVGGADFAVFAGELESLEYAEGFVNGTSDGEVIDGGMLDDAIGVDDEEAAECDSIVGEDAVVGGDLFIEISGEGVVESVDAAGVARAFGPGEVGKFAIDADADDFGVELEELIGAVGEGEDFSGADEGEIEGVEEEDEPFSLVVFEGEGLELADMNRFHVEVWCVLSNNHRHRFFL